ncbi:methyltransferase domain-containing protein [Croceibacterium sp. LX-88]|uniref:Methyltransferase domain-containing protein n=1 Tax=Croceibacterium selenioxidans TaxID=2838833 RepID=A0ABS5W2V6_9SPHN|nr:methyltransferase domain-containing protein [Croceibacterium selenioxidans]
MEEAITGPFHQRRIDLTLDLIRCATQQLGTESPRILDVGCGEGHITAEIQKSFPKAEIHALDYSLSAISKAYKQFPDISFSVADALRSPYPEGPFDIVVCNNLWEHVTDPIGLLERMKSVLRPQGFVIISTPSRFRTQNLARAIIGRPVTMMSRHHVTEYTVGQVHEQLAFGGFEVAKAISRRNPAGGFKDNAARAVFNAWRLLSGSHHELESTIFYLARALR